MAKVAVVNFKTSKGQYEGVEITIDSEVQVMNYLLENAKRLDIYEVTEYFIED